MTSALPMLAYIAAPYGAPTARERRRNVERARFLARLAVLEGQAPIVVHLAIGAGVFGPDDDPACRAFGLQADLAQLTAVARARGMLWLLRRTDGSLSAGCEVEERLWDRLTRGFRRRAGTWDDYRTLAERYALGDEHAELAPARDLRCRGAA